jgi:hypothetical protein
VTRVADRVVLAPALGGLFLAALALVGGPLGRAQDAELRRDIAVESRHGRLVVTGPAHELVDEALRTRLGSGLPQWLVTHVSLHRSEDETALARGVRTCRVAYDLWARTFHVERQLGSDIEPVSHPELEAVVERCVDLDGIELRSELGAPLASGERASVRARLELNPLSPDTVHRIRQWLARPDGREAGGETFFGRFVGLLVNRRIGVAERVVAWRSEEDVVVP